MNKKNSPKNKQFFILAVFLIFFGGMFLYKTSPNTAELQIIGREKALLIETKSQEFLFGTPEQFPRKLLNEVFLILENSSEETIGKLQKAGESSFTQLSKNTGIFSYKNRKILFFGSEFSEEDEFSSIISHPVSLSVDFWVATHSQIPFKKLPIPKEGVLFLGKKIPGKLLTEFCTQYSIPLLSYAQTKGFEILLNEKNSWEIFPQNPLK